MQMNGDREVVGLDGPMHVYDTILDAVGETPLVRLNSVTSNLPCTVLAKVESFNPGGSVKDRIGFSIIQDAEQSGRLKPGGTIVEATSGNTGVGLAIAAALNGYRSIFVMPDKMSQEKIMLLRAYGARVVVTPTAVEPEDPRSYYSVANQLVEETPNAILANQYHNPVNPRSHYETTGPEIWRQTRGRITHLVAGVGTGGTITGTGRYLKERNRHIKTIGIDPVGSILYELHRSGRHSKADGYKVEGIGEDFLPGTTDLGVIDTMVQVSDKESFLMTRRLVREEGIFCGGSSGTAVAGAIKYGYDAHLEKDDVMVIILPDSGTRYLSKVFDDDWMRENGFLERAWIDYRARDIQEAKPAGELLLAKPDELVTEVVARLKEHGVSQLPVVTESGQLVGLVSEIDLLNHMLSATRAHEPDETIESMVDQNVPVVRPNVPLETLVGLFSEHSAVVISTGEEITGILTKIDILDFLATRSARP
jgi:cystathionine beta-synthase